MRLVHITSGNNRKFTELHNVLCKCISHASLYIALVVFHSIHFVWRVFIFCKLQLLPQNTVKTKKINTTPLSFVSSLSSFFSVSHPNALKLS